MMDNLATPQLEPFKPLEPTLKADHVENVDALGVEAHESQLPRGIEPTDYEKEHKFFTGAIDQGTTSSRFLIFNDEGEPIAGHQIEFENLYPESG